VRQRRIAAGEPATGLQAAKTTANPTLTHRERQSTPTLPLHRRRGSRMARGWPLGSRTDKLFIRPVFRDGDRPRGRSFRASALSRSCDCRRAAPGDL